MKRDWHLIQEILEAIEQNKVRCHWNSLESAESKRLVLLHYDLLQESGLITNYVLDSDMDDDFHVEYHPKFTPEAPGAPYMHLTMAGYDLLEVLRDRQLWNAITSKAKGLSVKLTWEFIRQAIPVIYKSLL